MPNQSQRHPLGYVYHPVVKDVEVSEQGTMAKFLLPSISVDELDRSGNIALWKVAKIFECARATAVLHPDFFITILSTKNPELSFFIILLNLEIEQSMYRKTSKKLWFGPLRLSTSLTGFGRTTADYVTIIQDASDNERLGLLRFKYALVNVKQRKAVEISSSIKEELRAYYKPEFSVKTYKPASRPPNAYCMSVVVHSSDIDHNGHMNNSVYVRMCLDCAAESCFDHKMRYFQGDIAKYLSKSMNALYSAECRTGDKVDVYCWQDKDNPLILHFSILKSEQPSFQCMIEFYPKIIAKL